jgi:hypothetical protein
MLMGFSITTAGAGFDLIAGFASFARALTFAAGFFLAGVFVAMTDPIPDVNVEWAKKVRHS